MVYDVIARFDGGVLLSSSKDGNPFESYNYCHIKNVGTSNFMITASYRYGGANRSGVRIHLYGTGQSVAFLGDVVGKTSTSRKRCLTIISKILRDALETKGDYYRKISQLLESPEWTSFAKASIIKLSQSTFFSSQ
jgi:hypothetical protein